MNDEARPMRRKDRELLDRADIDRILDEAELLHLGLWDGEEPYLVPVNFVRVGEDLFFHGAPEGRKVDILRARPRLCFSAVAEAQVVAGANACDCTTYYRSATGWGVASFLEDQAEKAAALAALNRKFGAPEGPLPPKMLAATAVVRIRVDRVTGKAKPRRD